MPGTQVPGHEGARNHSPGGTTDDGGGFHDNEQHLRRHSDEPTSDIG